MGLLEKFFPKRQQIEFMERPWPVTFDWNSIDPLDILTAPMTRWEALTIPGVARAHHTIVSKLAQMQLVADNGSGVENTPQPTFLDRGDLGEPPEFRMWLTADDLYFHGSSLWVVARGSMGQILGARWLPRERWNFDGEYNSFGAVGTINIDQAPANPNDYLLFNIPMWAGLLGQAQRTLMGARDIERAWTARMRAPAAIINLEVSDDAELSQEEVDAYVKAWQQKHYSGAPAVGMTPPGVKMTVNKGSLGDGDLFTKSRDQIRTDIGSHAGIDGGMVDSTGGAGSLTYETQEGQRADFYEFDLPFWTIPITARLSLNDVVPNGTRIQMRFRPVIAPDNIAASALQRRFTTSLTGPAPAEPGGDTSGQQEAV
ncbi:MAG TPA: hypothetical protein VN133_05280 [Humibacter sp.]|nr:hypothetical protein [Humibacter sp.]